MDIIHDNSHRNLLKLTAVVGEENLPAYVTEYNVPTEKIASDFTSDLFADDINRLFPIDCKASTWLSAGYCALDKTAEEIMNPAPFCTLSHIKAAATVWGIEADLDGMLKRIASFKGQPKCASAEDDNYGWIIKDATGETIRRRYAMFDANGVTKAATFFDESRKHYPHDIRKGIATKILEKAGEFGVDITELPSSIGKEAGDGIPRKSVIMRELNERAKLAADTEYSTLLENVTRTLGAADEGEIVGAMDKLAATIEAFDQAEGLVEHYGTKITYPCDFMSGVSIKCAQEFVDSSIALRSHVFDITKLATLDSDVFETVLGPAFTQKVAADGLGPALRELSKPAKGALETHLLATFA